MVQSSDDDGGEKDLRHFLQDYTSVRDELNTIPVHGSQEGLINHEERKEYLAGMQCGKASTTSREVIKGTDGAETYCLSLQSEHFHTLANNIWVVNIPPEKDMNPQFNQQDSSTGTRLSLNDELIT